ncbi:Ubiquitin carboxyl-terminal hydrolase 32, partial [Ophiophagus hannah]
MPNDSAGVSPPPPNKKDGCRNWVPHVALSSLCYSSLSFKICVTTTIYSAFQSPELNYEWLKVDSAFHPSDVGKMRTQIVGVQCADSVNCLERTGVCLFSKATEAMMGFNFFYYWFCGRGLVSGRTRSNECKHIKERFNLELRRNFLAARTINQWNGFFQKLASKNHMRMGCVFENSCCQTLVNTGTKMLLCVTFDLGPVFLFNILSGAKVTWLLCTTDLPLRLYCLRKVADTTPFERHCFHLSDFDRLGCYAVEESDIIDLEKRYWLLKAQSRTGRFDLETFGLLVSPPIHPSLSEVQGALNVQPQRSPKFLLRSDLPPFYDLSRRSYLWTSTSRIPQPVAVAYLQLGHACPSHKTIPSSPLYSLHWATNLERLEKPTVSEEEEEHYCSDLGFPREADSSPGKQSFMRFHNYRPLSA